MSQWNEYTELGEHTFLRRRANAKRYEIARKYIKGKTLEVGCGKCQYAKALKAKDYTGVDISPEYIKDAKKRGFNALVMDAENLKFKDNTFDTVVFFEAIEHLDHPEKALDEIRRILKPNGIALITTPNIGVTLKGYNNPFHKKMYTTKELERLLIKKGFKIAARKGIFCCRSDFPFCSAAAMVYEKSMPFRLQPIMMFVAKK